MLLYILLLRDNCGKSLSQLSYCEALEMYLSIHMYNLEWMELIGYTLHGLNVHIIHWLCLLLQNFPDILSHVA